MIIKIKRETYCSCGCVADFELVIKNKYTDSTVCSIYCEDCFDELKKDKDLEILESYELVKD